MGFDMSSAFDSLGIMAKAWDVYSSYDALADKNRSDARVYSGNYDMDMASAADARKRGVRDVENVQRRTKVLAGAQRTAMGSSGVVVGSGSFQGLLSDTEATGKQDSETAWENALREAYGYEVSANNSKNRAGAANSAVKDADNNALLGTIGSLASGVYDYGTTNWGW